MVVAIDEALDHFALVGGNVIDTESLLGESLLKVRFIGGRMRVTAASTSEPNND
jgi:hypothetical protein